MRNFFLGVLTSVAVLGIAILVYIRLGLVEVRGDVPPSRLESYLLTSAVHAAVQRSAPDMANPVPTTDETLIAGGKQYLGECEGCHGRPGRQRKFGTGLNPDAPQFATVGTSTPKRRYCGLRNTASAGQGCSRTACGTPTRNCGPWLRSSSA